MAWPKRYHELWYLIVWDRNATPEQLWEWCRELAELKPVMEVQDVQHP